MPSSDHSDWGKFRLLLWKNFHVQWNNRFKLVCCILAPAIFSIILVFLRCSINLEKIQMRQYHDIDLDAEWKAVVSRFGERKATMDLKINGFTYNNFIPRPVVSYAPNTYDAFNNIMNLTETFLGIVKVNSFTKCEKMLEVISMENHIAGICFHDSQMHERSFNQNDTHTYSVYPLKLNYSLVFPNELRFYTNIHIGSTWKTNILFDFIGKYVQSAEEKRENKRLVYIREGYISLQNFVSMSYIQLVSNESDIPKVKMRSFPYPGHDYDRMTESNKLTLPLVILCGFIYPVIYITTYIVGEKESKLKIAIKIVGFNNLINFCAWFVTGLTWTFASTVLMLVVLKIHWNEDLGIFSKSSWLPLLSFFFSYNVVTVCFCCMMSAFFKRNATAVILSGMIWYFTYLPFAISINNVEYKDGISTLKYLFSNTAMSFAIDLVLDFEQYDNGLKWHGLLKSHPANDTFSIGKYIGLFYLQSMAYTVIGCYVEELNPGLYGIPKRWNYLFSRYIKQRISHHPSKPIMDSSGDLRIRRIAQVFEISSEAKQTTVEIIGLTKEYNKDIVVKEVFLDLCEGDITCLMGHNGCGKTTLISMIVGMIPPTYGTATINGFDIRTQQRFAQAGVGVCLRDSVLYNDFTVAHQLAFFSQLKGMNNEEAEIEVEKYLEAMNLQDKRNTLTKNLSIGLRQQVAVCCALAGDSKVVFLDEADRGMDLASTKLFWEMLIREKRGRTILLTTHSTDDTEILADRVVIMSGGKVTCHGSTLFLKKIYGQGYRLICNKNRHCDDNSISELIQQYIPNITPESNIGSELTYRLDDRYIDVLPKLLKKLEQNLTHLNLEMCSITETKMEDIFLKMGSDDFVEDDKHRLLGIMSGISIHIDEYELLSLFSKYEPLRGLQLILSHCHAMIWKNLTFMTRYEQYIFPIFFTIFSLIMMNGSSGIVKPKTFTLSDYYKTKTVVDTRPSLNDMSKQICERYREYVFWFQGDHELEDTFGELFESYMLEKAIRQQSNTHLKYPVGATFGQDGIIAWFNSFPLHSAPLSISMVHNAILQTVLSDSNAAITVWNSPLPMRTEHHGKLLATPMNFGIFLTLNLAVCTSFIWTFCVIYLIKERKTRFKMVQFISGVRLCTFWMAAFIYDCTKIFVVTLIILFSILAFHYNDFKDITGWFFVTMMSSGACIISWHYLLSHFFKDPTSGYAILLSFNIFGCIGFYAFIDTLHIGYNKPLPSAEVFTYFFVIFPHFSLSKALYKIFTKGEMRLICEDDIINVISTKLEDCKAVPNCCLSFDIWDWNDGIKFDLCMLYVFTTVCWIMLYFIESRMYLQIRFLFRDTPADNRESALYEYKRNHDSDIAIHSAELVESEKLKVLRLLPRDYYNTSLVIDRVGKFHGNQATVNRLCLIVERGECFGLIGANGSGKTTLFEMLIGETQMNFGRAFVEGINVQTDYYKMYEKVGYLPQDDCIFTEYTGYELMKIVCLLRGTPRYMVKNVCESLAKALGFFKYLNKKTMVYSTGNKKRLAFAFALLGTPSLVYLDDPTLSIDPAGKRQMWNILCKFRESGNSIVFSSVSIQACEIICDRLALISQGRLLCIGTPLELLDIYLSQKYLLIVKINNVQKTKRVNMSIKTPLMKIVSFVETEFPDSVWKDQYGNLLIFSIPHGENSMSHIFTKIANNSSHLNIEHFEITTGALHTVYEDLLEQEKTPFESES